MLRVHDARTGSLELRGELPHWRTATPMTPVGEGWFEAALRLGPGVYDYKLVAPGAEWRLDARNPRTRGREGAQNSVLVVDGTDEPVLHAPAPPWIEKTAGGRIVVRAALRKTAGASLALRFWEGAAARAVGMTRVGEEDEHGLFEAVVPGAGRFIEYDFVLPGGAVVGAAGGALRVDRRELDPRGGPAPAWWQDAVVYSVFVDRFRRGDGPGGAVDGSRVDREHFAGGDLDGVRAALPYLADLGVTALHLTPIAVAASPHRYDVIDPFAVDPRLGGEAALARLVEAADAHGVRLLLDVTTTHVHRHAAPFCDVAARGPESPYWSWFKVLRWPFVDGPDPGYAHYQKGQWQEPLLVTTDEGVEEHLAEVVAHWARRGVAGFRLDAAADLPPGLCGRLAEAARAVQDDAVVFGEIVPASIERWTATGELDAATDFAAGARVGDWLAGRLGAPEAAADAARKRFARGSVGSQRLAFVSNHDQGRLGTALADVRAARLGQLLALTGAALPLLYYGDEVGLVAAAEAGAAPREFEDAWPDRQAMPWTPEAWDHATLGQARALTRLRRARPVLARGDEQWLAAGDDADVIVVRRALGRAVVDVIARRGGGAADEAPVRVPLPATTDPDAGAALVHALGDARLDDDGEAVWLGPWAAAIVDRAPATAASAATAALPLLADANAALAARACAEGMTASPAYPTRLYLTVTEACNLRCAHCITDAPRLTREGRDRTARPWLLEALAEPFAHADYLAFTHGGESLTTPMLYEAMAAFRRARAGRRGRADVHLATNGMLLDEARLGRLVDLGLTSVMVSIDGASAAVNDRIRVGGSLERVLANVRAALAFRARTGADLRLGLSSVLGRANRHEVLALAELAVQLGVDWLKLEETYPATPFARLDLIPPRDPGLVDAVATAGARLAEGGVVFVDHLDPPGGCHDGPAAVFRAADDYANRTRFAPCRMAWEQACIDPDGTVHAVDWAQPALGRAGERDFLSLWNAAPARALRSAALATTPAEHRRRCAQASRPE